MCSGVGRVAHYDPEPSGVATVTIRQVLGWAGLSGTRHRQAASHGLGQDVMGET
jgi:hypothetical protein